ncbi:MAG: proline dehydrogenase [Bacteroidia bacterium]|jgi:proline dehydrogenase
MFYPNFEIKLGMSIVIQEKTKKHDNFEYQWRFSIIFVKESAMAKLSFENTEIAFKHKSNQELKEAKWLFSIFKHPTLIKYGPPLTAWALKLHLPIKGFVKATVFKHFCGGETIAECVDSADELFKYGVGSILDYSVEGVEDEASFDANFEEIKLCIFRSKKDDRFPFAVFKTTGIARFDLLKRINLGDQLSKEESAEFDRVKKRFTGLSDYAVESGVRLFIDAEETWIQNVIDGLAIEMMQKHNKNKVMIYNTLQMYRKDRLDHLVAIIASAKSQGYNLGFKLVRGAYMEKERERAMERDYKSPIQDDKEATHRAFDEAVSVCFENRDIVSICVGSHNEDSALKLVKLMEKANIAMDDDRFYFAQLYGMSDIISFNLAHAGYRVCKYLPYGPIKAVMPYLGRRAQENSSVAGQVGREMNLIVRELKRRSI